MTFNLIPFAADDKIITDCGEQDVDVFVGVGGLHYSLCHIITQWAVTGVEWGIPGWGVLQSHSVVFIPYRKEIGCSYFIGVG